MIEIHTDDLRVTTDEAVAFLNQVMGLNLSTQDVTALEARTEGWIAALQLAAISMQGIKRSSDVADFIHRFTGSDRYIQDYLTDCSVKDHNPPLATRRKPRQPVN